MPDISEKPRVFGMILSHNCEGLLLKALDRIPRKYFDTIFITDDGSKEVSLEIAKSTGLPITYAPQGGYGANVLNGIRYAFDNGADYVVEIHGDGAQFDPGAIVGAIPHIEQGCDFIIGSRFMDKRKALQLGMPLPRFFANICLSFFDRLVLGLPFSEFHTGFRIYGKRFKSVPLELNTIDYLFSFEIMAQAAYYRMSVAEVPVECDYISDHTSHSYVGASIYAIQHFLTLTQFMLARMNIKRSGIFADGP